MKAYFISGLGADERVFNFLNLPGLEKIFIKWVPPRPKEPLKNYSKRLIEQIDTREEIILVGVSFGGIVAQEIAKIIACKKIIIISSIKSYKELGWQLSLIRRTGLFKLLPPTAIKKTNGLADYYFGTNTKGESILLKQVIQDTDDDFFQWAIHQMMRWNHDDLIENLIHIHGTKDRIFPFYAIKRSIPIKGGGHLMIVNRAEEISSILLDKLKEVPSPS